MSKRHKHADLIHAWAEGAEIETREKNGEWYKQNHPVFYPSWQYRIKPSKPLIDEETRKAIKHLFPDARNLVMEKNHEAYINTGRALIDEDGGYWKHAGMYTRIPGLDNYAPDWRTSRVDLNEEVR